MKCAAVIEMHQMRDFMRHHRAADEIGRHDQPPVDPHRAFCRAAAPAALRAGQGELGHWRARRGRNSGPGLRRAGGALRPSASGASGRASVSAGPPSRIDAFAQPHPARAGRAMFDRQRHAAIGQAAASRRRFSLGQGRDLARQPVGAAAGESQRLAGRPQRGIETRTSLPSGASRRVRRRAWARRRMTMGSVRPSKFDLRHFARIAPQPVKHRRRLCTIQLASSVKICCSIGPAMSSETTRPRTETPARWTASRSPEIR